MSQKFFLFVMILVSVNLIGCASYTGIMAGQDSDAPLSKLGRHLKKEAINREMEDEVDISVKLDKELEKVRADCIPKGSGVYDVTVESRSGNEVRFHMECRFRDKLIEVTVNRDGEYLNTYYYNR